MRLGRGVTAVLVRLPVCCRVKTAIRRQASWLAKKASVISNSRWPFALQKYPSCTEASHPARGKLARRRLRRKGKSAHSSALQKYPSYIEASQPARGKPARRQLRRSRAAIGSGGKRPAHFDGGKRRAPSAHERKCWQPNCAARDIASPAVKMGNRSLFPSG